MDRYYFGWQADCKDESAIVQYGKGEETPFSAVEEQMDDVIAFQILAEDGEYYKIDLETGELDLNGKITKNPWPMPEGMKAELIYKRRKQVRADIRTGEQLEERTKFLIGGKWDGHELYAEVFPGLGQTDKSVKVFTDGEEEDLTAELNI